MEILRSIVYVSSATDLMTASQLESLLAEARDANRASRITGALLCNDGNFMQCFEGSSDAVYATWHRIQSSRRHKGIIQLSDQIVSTRSFPDWQMAFARATDSDLLTSASASWQDIASLPESRESCGIELLQQFWQNAR